MFSKIEISDSTKAFIKKVITFNIIMLFAYSITNLGACLAVALGCNLGAAVCCVRTYLEDKRKQQSKDDYLKQMQEAAQAEEIIENEVNNNDV